MNNTEFAANAHKIVDWISEYLRTIERYPVRSQVLPGQVMQQLPEAPPQSAELFEQIMEDFNKIIMPGITHWQHPMFYAYFPANASLPSVLAEMLTAALGLQCMLWETSQAATELEQRLMEWVRTMIGLPSGMTGVIQDTASVATLCALLNAREVATSFRTNQSGLNKSDSLTVYASAEAHSSVEKAVRIAGIGSDQLRRIAVDEKYRMQPAALGQAIEEDLAQGRRPMAIVATLGTTGSASVDPLEPISAIAARYGIWLHVDAAYGGAALLLPELRGMIDGIEQVNSFVFNPHKWLMVNFDCSLLYVKDAALLRKTFEILPEYLKTNHEDEVCDFRNYGIQLGRRFRALKLWFAIRSYGVEGLQLILRQHLAFAEQFEEWLLQNQDFEVLAPRSLSLVCFRYRPLDVPDGPRLDALNRRLLSILNASGELYLSHTKLSGKFTLRLAIGQCRTTQEHVRRAYEQIVTTARKLDLGENCEYCQALSPTK